MSEKTLAALQSAMIPISILGQPTKDDVAEGKRGGRQRQDTYRTDICLMEYIFIMADIFY